jgi:hypothetical protein
MSTEEGELCVSDSLEDSHSRKFFSQVFLSQPRTGKHILFDGRLLHGAPSEPSLRESARFQSKDNSNQDPLSHMRITFLVNIWLTKRPNKVSILPNPIRQIIMDASNGHESLMSADTIEFKEQIVERLTMNHDSFGRDPEKISLPFVSKGATWIDSNEGDDDDEEEGTDNLVVSMFPPNITSDSLLICYRDGYQPFFENQVNYEGVYCEETADDEVDYEEAYV